MLRAGPARHRGGPHAGRGAKLYEYYDAPPLEPPAEPLPRPAGADGGAAAWFRVNETRAAALERGEWDGSAPPTLRDVLESFGVVRPLADIPAAEQAAASAACAAAQACVRGLWGGVAGGPSASAERGGGADGARSGSGGSSDSLSSEWELFLDSHERASARRFLPP